MEVDGQRDFKKIGQDFRAGDINNSTSIPNYRDGPYRDLGIYVNEVLSAWSEVWTGTWPSSKRFWFPGVVLGRFSSF